MLEDFRLKVFEAVERLRSFSAAAIELGVSQPAVSQNIAELERQTGEKLFERDGHGVALTEKGELFSSYAHQILHWYDVTNEVFSQDGPSQEPKVLEMENGRRALVWTKGNDIHITFKD